MSVGTMSVIDHTGDTKIEWNSDVPAEVEHARETFDKFRNEHKYLAYSLEADGSRGEVIREFDPAAEAIVMAPQTVGG